MKKILFLLALLFPIAAHAQTAAYSGFCDQGATSAVTSGLSSTNKLQGIIPYCTVTVYLTGQLVKATIYKDALNTPQTNPFQAPVNGQITFFVATGQGYDIVKSGGIYPLVYTTPLTVTDWQPGGGGGTTTNALTFATGGGVAPNSTFNGSGPVTIDYHSVGAQANLSLLKGTYIDGDLCSYTSSGTLLNCNTTPYSLPSTVVQTNQPNTYDAHLQDFSAASMRLPVTQANNTVVVASQNPGSGYTSNPAIALSGGTCSISPSLTVIGAGSGGNSVYFQLLNQPVCTVLPLVSVTGGGGSSASVTLGFAGTTVGAVSSTGAPFPITQTGSGNSVQANQPTIVAPFIENPVLSQFPGYPSGAGIFDQVCGSNIPILFNYAPDDLVLESCSGSGYVGFRNGGQQYDMAAFSNNGNGVFQIFSPFHPGIDLDPTLAGAYGFPSSMGVNYYTNTGGALVLMLTYEGTGYTGVGACTLSGGTLLSGDADTCSASISGGQIIVSLSGSGVYTIPPALSVAGLVGGVGYTNPVVALNNLNTPGYTLFWTVDGKLHYASGSVTNPGSDLFSIDKNGNLYCAGTGCGGGGSYSYLTCSSELGAQINAAVTALGTAGGVIVLPDCSTATWTTTGTLPYLTDSLIGYGPQASSFTCSAGTCLVVAPPEFSLTTGLSTGGELAGFSIVGNGASNQVLIHTEDLIGWSLHDIGLDNVGTGGACLWMEDVARWTERNWANSVQTGYRCTEGVRMSNNASNSYQPGSFGHNHFWFNGSSFINQFGMTFKGNMLLYDGELHYNSNLSYGMSLHWQDTATAENEYLDLNYEGNGGSYGYDNEATVQQSFYGATNNPFGGAVLLNPAMTGAAPIIAGFGLGSVSSINGVGGPVTFTGSGQSCTGSPLICTFTGGSGGGTTTNALTMNNSGSGASSGTTFNGSAAETISYNTIGAQPLLTNPVTGPGSGATVGHLAVMGNASGTSITDGGAVPSVGTWGALNYPSWSSGTPFVKMTAAGTFSLDTNIYTSVKVNGGTALSTENQVGLLPYLCADTSGSGTAQSCTTTPSFTPQVGNCLVYTTTTPNSGTSLTLNVDSSGPLTVQIPSASGWVGVYAASQIPANTPLTICYYENVDSVFMWNVQQTGTVSAGSGGVPSVNSITSAVTIAGGTGISVGTVGGTVTITNTGGGGTSPGVPTVTFLNGTAGTLSTGYTDFSGTITFTTGVTNPNNIFSLTFGGTYSTPLSCGAQVNDPFASSAQRQIYATTNPASTSVNFVSYTTNPLTLNALDVGNRVSWWCIPTGVISGGGGGGLFSGVLSTTPTQSGTGLTTTWNSSGSTFSVANGTSGIVLTETSNSVTQPEGQIGAFPSGSGWTRTALLSLNPLGSQYTGVGIVLLSNPTSGGLEILKAQNNQYISLLGCSSFSVSSCTTLARYNSNAVVSPFWWFRVQLASGTLYYSISVDGNAFVPFYSEPLASGYLSSGGYNYLGVELTAYDAPSATTLLSWQ